MLLRGSGQHTGDDYSFTGIMDGDSETGVPHGALLGRFADGVHAGDFVAERAEIEQTLGWNALVDAAATVAIFAAVVKVADATGIPLEDFKAETSAGFRAELGIDGFART